MHALYTSPPSSCQRNHAHFHPRLLTDIHTRYIHPVSFYDPSLTLLPAAVPTFKPTEDENVDNLLSHMRTAHFLPAFLSPRDFKTITRPQNKAYLEDNPLSVDVGGEEVEFKYFDRSDRTGRVHLLHEIYDAMAQSEGGKGWNELPALLYLLRLSRLPRRLFSQSTLTNKLFGFLNHDTRQSDCFGQVDTVILLVAFGSPFRLIQHSYVRSSVIAHRTVGG